jgi:hypothetical protein
MAESTDVCNAIANAVAEIVIPLVGGTYIIQEEVDADAVGIEQTVPPTLVVVSRPEPKDLEERLGEGKVMISVAPDETDAVTAQFVNERTRRKLLGTDPITLTVSSPTQNRFVFDGTATAGNIVGVQTGVNGAAYTVQGGDSLASIAASVAAKCREVGIGASSTGETLLVDPSSGLASVRIGAQSSWLQAVSRVARHYDVEHWCPDPHIRQHLVTHTEVVFMPGQKIEMPDGSEALISARIGTGFGSRESNAADRDYLFLARTRWLVEYVTTKIIRQAPIVAATVALGAIDIDPDAPLLASQL